MPQATNESALGSTCATGNYLVEIFVRVQVEYPYERAHDPRHPAPSLRDEDKPAAA